jgi:hypothetical protein
MFLYEIYQDSRISAIRDVLEKAKKYASSNYDRRCQDIKKKFIAAFMDSELLMKRAIEVITSSSKE